MNFLTDRPLLQLSDEGGKYRVFFAEVFSPRPPFNEIAGFTDAATSLAQQMETLVSRKASPISSVAILIDSIGACLLVSTAKRLQVQNARSAIDTVIAALPADQRLSVEQSIRPLDEVDANRIRAWQTVASLRPAGKKRAREEEEYPDDGEYVSLAKRARDVEANKKSTAQLLAEMDGSDSEEEAVAPPRLMLTDGPAPGGREDDEPDLLDPTSVWGHKVKTEATIVLVEVGARPEHLTFVRCIHEARRQLLLQSKVREARQRPVMRHVVEVAMQLAEAGSIPKAAAEHGRMSEFLRRCATALRAIDPKAETDIKKLGAEQEMLIRRTLGGKGLPYEGCFSKECLNKEAAWETSKVEPMSRCARCKCPKAFGRNVKSLGDILRLTTERCKANIGMETWRACKVSVGP
jgi:hypothetical protein